MGYTKNSTWTAPEGAFLNRFSKSGETDSSVELVWNPELTNTPTSFTTTRMNHIEDGIAAAHSAAEDAQALADHLNDPNAITAVADIIAAGTGTYYGTSITDAPETGAAIYYYTGDAVTGILRCWCGTSYAREWKRIRAGSAWATAWMYVGHEEAMADNTEYLIGYLGASSIYRKTITGSVNAGAFSDVVYTALAGTCTPLNVKGLFTLNNFVYYQPSGPSSGAYMFVSNIESDNRKSVMVYNALASYTNYYRITITYTIS